MSPNEVVTGTNALKNKFNEKAHFQVSDLYKMYGSFILTYVWLCFVNRLDQIFEYAEDIEIDIPQLWKYLGELMGPTAFDGNLNLDELFKCVLKYVSKHKAAKLFACMLQTATNDTVS